MMAAEVVVSVKHDKDLDTVKSSLTSAAESFDGLEFVPEWNSDTSADVAVSYGGFSTNGTITLSESSATVKVKIPRVARLFSSKISGELESAMKKALA